ncbi:MAG: hypothetical protein AMJ94_13590 [Deltaproteobacteria bacterium SM23_61]|nr:MAG: hypothetical protein AMJ94_13590 [Deltaproteobacteria bacterium SM23_61]
MILSSFFYIFLDLKKRPQKEIRIPLWPSYGQLQETPSHKILQRLAVKIHPLALNDQFVTTIEITNLMPFSLF